MSLTEYNRKRTFGKTPEPAGVLRARKRIKKQEALRVRRSKKSVFRHFVVQEHHASHLHYDFRLEIDGVLKSWAVPKGPSMDPSVKRLAMMVEDHPLSYMKFEGTIPKGNYGAGTVTVWDFGVYTSTTSAHPKESERELKRGIHQGSLKFVLLGEKLKGAFALVKIKSDEAKNKNRWLLIKEKDEFAERALKQFPFTPMLATLTDKPFDREGWIFEIKWDGYRAVTRTQEKSEPEIYSRNGISFNERYPSIARALSTINHDVILDGEIVALNRKGISDFNALQHYPEKKVPLTYVVFDILSLDGRDLHNLPLLERKKILKGILPNNPHLMYSEHVENVGIDFFKQAQKMHLEGIMAKNGSSIYTIGKRSEEWIKIKNIQKQEAIIVGFTKPRGLRKHFGSLVLAVNEGGRYKYVGHSGGGFTDQELKDLSTKMKPLIRTTSPLEEKVPINSPITWLRPQLVCEIEFTEWTKDGRMRHPIYAGLREDKKTDQVVQENSAPSFTHLDKIYFPDDGITKGDIIDYYRAIAPYILPYLKDRPESLNRHPHGIYGEHFFQKNITNKVPDFVRTYKTWSESNEQTINYVLCNNIETLLYLANLGCIELNPWNSRIDNPDNPDFMIIDLDPGKVDFKNVIKVALHAHKVLDYVCGKNYIKTSGKRGLHIVVPMGAKYSYDQVKNFAELIANVVYQELPDITSVERSPSKRRSQIYLDFLQNRRGQTLAAPYSVRPTQGAAVSTPLEWSEVNARLDPKKFTIHTILNRMKKKGDLWKPLLVSKGIDLKESIERLQKYIK